LFCTHETIKWLLCVKEADTDGTGTTVDVELFRKVVLCEWQWFIAFGMLQLYFQHKLVTDPCCGLIRYNCCILNTYDQWRKWREGRGARRPPGKLNVKNGPPSEISWTAEHESASKFLEIRWAWHFKYWNSTVSSKPIIIKWIVNSKLLQCSGVHCTTHHLTRAYCVWCNNQWWSLETWSRLETHFCECRSRRLQVSRLKFLNIAKKWFIKFAIIQRFFVCCICR